MSRISSFPDSYSVGYSNSRNVILGIVQYNEMHVQSKQQKDLLNHINAKCS